MGNHNSKIAGEGSGGACGRVGGGNRSRHAVLVRPSGPAGPR